MGVKNALGLENVLAELEGHSDFRTGEGIGVFSAVDASTVDFVDDLRLFNLLEAEFTEKFRFKGEDDCLRGFETFDTLKNEFDKLFSDAFTAICLIDGHGLEFYGGAFGRADFGQDLPTSTGDDCFAVKRNRKAVNIFNNIVD
jgi:hypothetical protein